MNLLRTPAIRDLVQNDLGDLYLRTANPGDALAVEFNLRGENNGHSFLLAPVYATNPAGAVLAPIAIAGNFLTLPAVQSSAVSYTHLRAHETRHDLVCRLLLEKKK